MKLYSFVDAVAARGCKVTVNEMRPLQFDAGRVAQFPVTRKARRTTRRRADRLASAAAWTRYFEQAMLRTPGLSEKIQEIYEMSPAQLEVLAEERRAAAMKAAEPPA